MRHSCRFLPPPPPSPYGAQPEAEQICTKWELRCSPIPFLSPSSPVWLAGGEIADMESRHHLKVVKSSLSLQRGCLSLSAWKWRGREGEEWQSHPESEWGGRTRHAQFPFLPPSLPKSFPIRVGVEQMGSLSPPICIAAAILIALITFAQQRSEEGAASECSADGATHAAQGC